MIKSIAQICLEADHPLEQARAHESFKGHPKPDVLRFHFTDNSYLDFQMSYTPIAAGRTFDEN